MNMCTEASNSFLVHLEKYGLKAEIEHYSLNSDAYHEVSDEEVERDLARFPFDTDGCRFHWAVRVGNNLIIDWTARQFCNDAGFPEVWVDNAVLAAPENRLDNCENILSM